MKAACAALPVLLFASCGSSPEPAPKEAKPAETPQLAETGPRLQLPRGSWIRLELDVSSPRNDYPLALRIWMHEALAQSPYFDFARNDTGPIRLIVRGNDPAANGGRGRLIASLSREEGELIPLKGVDFDATRVVAAIDQLAVETRRALGESEELIEQEQRSCGLFVSRVERCAAHCERALQELADGHRARAAVELDRALRADGRSPLALSLLAGLRADGGRTQEARDLASRVTRLAERASPTSFNRALRIRQMLEQRFEEMRDVAESSLELRPHDPDLRFSRAFAYCMLGQYSQAEADLDWLRTRFPHRPGPLFCGAHVQLALGQPERVLESRADIERILPEQVAFRIIANALLLCERHDELATQLRLASERLARDPSLPSDLSSELAEMRAAHAILQRKDAEAAGLLLNELDRLRADSRLLARRAERLPDLSWTLCRLGRAKDIGPFLQAVESNTVTRVVRPYIETARAIARSFLAKGPTDKELAAIRNSGQISWSERLAAQRAARSGQFDVAQRYLANALARAEQLGPALEQAELWESLGKSEQAKPIFAALRRELLRPQMANPGGFALARPELAIMAR
jgi:tetratricopeptide (TPR) repeat protein